MTKSIYKYVVIDDDIKVCENIKKRMSKYKNWNCEGLIVSLSESLSIIQGTMPNLVFLDWSIKGGNAFTLLEKIEKIEYYNPYIIFFTGYQNDHPEIPVELINRFKINKYLIKPIFENLTINLDKYIKEAEFLHIANPINEFWVEDINKVKIQINPHDIICISQSINPRAKIFHTKNDENIEVKASWSLCERIAKEFKIEYCITKSRETIINKKFITKLHRPFIWLNNRIKVEVTKDKWKELGM